MDFVRHAVRRILATAGRLRPSIPPDAIGPAFVAGVLLLAPLAMGAFAPAELIHGGDPLARVIELTNRERSNAGLQPLAPDEHLEHAAQSYAEVLATSACWGHKCGPEPDFRQRSVNAGYLPWRYLGENVAGGQRSPENVVAAWMASPSHRDNILHPWYREIGVGLAYGGRLSIYWAQEFGTRDGANATVPAYRASWVRQSPVPVLRPDEQAHLWVELRNTGLATWFRGGPTPVRLGTAHPRDHASVLATPGDWLSDTRAASLVQERVRPGESGRFAFTITAPQTAGRYEQYFSPLAEGDTWFNDLGLYFLLRVLP